MEALVNEKIRAQSFSKVDRRKGDFRSLRWLIKAEGFTAAMNYAKKCIELGGDWVEWDEMWNMDTFLVLRHQYEEEMRNAWELRSKSKSEPSVAKAPSAPSPHAAEAAPSKANAVVSPAATEAPKEVDAAKRKTTGEGGPDDGAGEAKAAKAAKKGNNAPKPPKTPKKSAPAHDEDPLKKAVALKKNWNNVMGVARMLAKRIKNNTDWEYFNNPASLEPLETAVTDADDAAYKDLFIQEYLSSGTPKEMTEAYGEQEMRRHCCGMIHTMDAKITAVAKETSRLVNMKEARDNA